MRIQLVWDRSELAAITYRVINEYVHLFSILWVILRQSNQQFQIALQPYWAGSMNIVVGDEKSSGCAHRCSNLLFNQLFLLADNYTIVLWGHQKGLALLCLRIDSMLALQTAYLSCIHLSGEFWIAAGCLLAVWFVVGKIHRRSRETGNCARIVCELRRAHHGWIRVWRILDEESTMLILNLCNSQNTN